MNYISDKDATVTVQEFIITVGVCEQARVDRSASRLINDTPLI